MSENTENTNKTKSETVKIDGISAQINLGTGSETHRRFAQFVSDQRCPSREAVSLLLDAYDNQANDLRALDELRQRIQDLQSECAAHNATEENLNLEIADLNKQLDEARNEANENAAKAMQIQTATEGAIILKPNPVSAYFLNEMAEDQKTTPGKILERLFIDDLQNPRANNLPYTVSSARIRQVMEELKQNQH